MKVSVKIIFSNNKKIGSKVISFFTNHFISSSLEETPSHVALLINERWVHESTLESGVRVMSYDRWLEINKEVYSIYYTGYCDYEILKEHYRNTKDKKYDWLGLCYLGFFIGLNKLFRMTIPKKNLLQSSDKYFCSEVLEKITNVDLSMKSPAQILKRFKIP
jgi:hypothetical protein